MLVDEIKNDPRKDAQAYAERVAGGFRPEIPRNWPAELVELISSCWAQVMRGVGQGIMLCFYWSPAGRIGRCLRFITDIIYKRVCLSGCTLDSNILSFSKQSQS